ncbi:hypothetical protein [Catenovulum sediminis]|uniref:hypothetical protein n=1 Tax=Catenovulum sediminis TaxID=1740262 RepID=UPI00117E9C0D|nr:hypothetical protein [Catenovulum sediminis]
MSALTQSLNTFIDDQIKTGSVSSEVEAEQLIQTAVFERVLDRKLARAEEQVKQGQYFEADENFISDVLTEAKTRIKTNN